MEIGTSRGANAYVMMHGLWNKSQPKAFSHKGIKQYKTWMVDLTWFVKMMNPEIIAAQNKRKKIILVWNFSKKKPKTNLI